MPDLLCYRACRWQLRKSGLNWASSDSLCAETICTKEASGVVYLTAAIREG